MNSDVQNASYRPDIDGLRALAVLPVVLFHLGIDALPGGFMGVDVFFVISGFLITRIIYHDIINHEFRFADFYERRIRRIFPALAAVTLITTAASFLWLLPQLFKDFAQSLSALALFSSNVLFYLEAGYFDADAINKPLLHTWSLSVEEQFYIVMPVALLLFATHARRFVMHALFLCFLMSLITCVVMTQRDSSFAFYLPFTRAWELLAGGMLGIYVLGNSGPVRFALPCIIIGLLGLFACYVFGDKQAFPGYVALAPVVSTCLLLYAGGAGTCFGVSRLYVNPGMVHTGKISYSLYLVHWPLVVFWTYTQGAVSSLGTSVLLLLACLLLAHTMYRYVETPFRDRHQVSRKLIMNIGFAFPATIICVGIVVNVMDGVPGRLPANVALAASFQENPERSRCHQKSAAEIEAGNYCVLGAPVTPELALIGDSHADAISAAITHLANSRGKSVAVFSRGGCRPFFNVALLARQCALQPGNQFSESSCQDRSMSSCAAFNRAVLNQLSQLQPETVVLSARWASQYYGVSAGNNDVCFSTSANHGCSVDNNRYVFQEGFNEMLSALDDYKQVYVIGPTPEFPDSVPTTAGKRELFGDRFPVPIDEDYSLRGRTVLTDMIQVAANYPNVKIIDLYPVLCPDGSCKTLVEGKPLYADAHHLSVFGNQYLEDFIELEIR